MNPAISNLNVSRLPERIKPQFRTLYTNPPKAINPLTLNKVHQGDAQKLLLQIEPNRIALSVWSPPYFVGKNYESHLSFNDWQKLLETVILNHFSVIKPGGFLIVNIVGLAPSYPLSDYRRRLNRPQTMEKNTKRVFWRKKIIHSMTLNIEMIK